MLPTFIFAQCYLFQFDFQNRRRAAHFIPDNKQWCFAIWCIFGRDKHQAFRAKITECCTSTCCKLGFRIFGKFLTCVQIVLEDRFCRISNVIDHHTTCTFLTDKSKNFLADMTNRHAFRFWAFGV